MRILPAVWFMLLPACMPLFGHGMNWSKTYIERNAGRLSIEIRINDQNLALLPEVRRSERPVDDLLSNNMSLVNSIVWSGVTVTVDGSAPGIPIDSGYNISGEHSDPQTQEGFHFHGRTVRFRKTWIIPDTSSRISIAFHLFSGLDIAMKWLVLAGSHPKWNTSINHPGETVTWDFRDKIFIQSINAPRRYLPLWIAVGISSVIIAVSAALYLLLAKRSAASADVKRT